MVKMEVNEEGLDDWKDITISPKGLFSGFGNDHYHVKSFGDIFCGGDGMYGGGYEGNDHVKEVENSTFDAAKVSAWEGCGFAGGGFGVHGGGLKSPSKYGASIAERRAMKCGFNAAKISTPRFRTDSPLPSPGVRSPRLTIPAGISPHVLLDSPILLANSQLSPTTGTFAPPCSSARDFSMVNTATPAEEITHSDGPSPSLCNSYADTTSATSFHDMEDQIVAAHGDCQSLTSLHPPMNFRFPVRFPTAGANTFSTSSPVDIKVTDDLSMNSNSSTLSPPTLNPLACVQMPPKIEPSNDDDLGSNRPSDGDLKEIFSATGTARTAEDGFNWRKYGQKQVKGSDYPRSYYKCTHLNCTVKKKVERSHDGHITEIIYKNTHNHPKPQPCRKSPFGSLPLNEASDIGEGRVEGSTLWRNIQSDVKIGQDWRIDAVEASVVTEASDPLSISQGKPMSALESAGTPELLSTLASYEDDEEAATPGDDLEVGSDSKRRKKDGCSETALGTRAVREPKVVVQIESEIDILDDGYRWRKYGQKVVKGNPNPRSYYKCTSAGCNVRKHVERASHDLKYVITTYEGKHNHEVPAARNGCNPNSGNGSMPPPSASAQPALTLPRNAHLLKTEPQDLPPHYNARLGCSNDFFRPNFLGAGAPPFYQMRFPTLPNSTPYGPFGLVSHPTYTSGVMPAIPDLPVPLPLGFPRSMASFPNTERPICSSIQPLYMGSQLEDNDVKLFRPKQEQRDESFCDTEMNSVEHSNSSSVYNNIMGAFPC